MSNKQVVKKLYKLFFNDFIHRRFITDKTGQNVVERLNYSMELDPTDRDFQVYGRKIPTKYAETELAWYDSQSLSIDPYMSDIKIWNQVCGKTTREINSNYGWCIYSKDNYNQYNNAINELWQNADSRRAIMIYTRPSMWNDYNRDGMSDFICTTAAQLFIRNNKLYYVVNQRSCDVVTGFWNDFAWHSTVYRRAFADLSSLYENLQVGKILYQCNSIHMYERSFAVMQNIARSNPILYLKYKSAMLKHKELKYMIERTSK